MKIAFFNDTRIETNMGCHATVDELVKTIREHLSPIELVFFPIGTANECFAKDFFCEKPLYKWIKKFKMIMKFLSSKKYQKFRYGLWKDIALKKLPLEVQEHIQSSDLVLINMEGTIHNNTSRSLTLLGIAYYAINQGAKVALVNGSYEAMNERLTKEVLSRVNFLSVREINSYDYLKAQNIEVSLIPDFAFRADTKALSFEQNLIFKDRSVKRCLYTVGVLGAYPNQPNGINMEFIFEHIEEIKRLGYDPYYLKVEENETSIAEALKNIGVHTLSYEDSISYKNFGIILEEFDLLITGRYHIGIFGIMNQIPTFFLKSNTYKVEGLLKMLKIEEQFIKDNDISRIKNKVDTVVECVLPEEENYKCFIDFLKTVN